MEYSQHTFIMALVLFTILAIISGILTRNASWKTFKLSSFIVILCIVRVLLPFESLDATVIRIEGFYASIDSFLRQKLFGNINLLHLLCFVWLIGAILSLMVLIYSLYRQWNVLKRCTTLSSNHSLYKLCSDSSLNLGVPFKGTIQLVPNFSSPGMIGFFKPHVILPDDIESFPSKYMPYVFYHELYHFKGKDSWILLGLEVLCCLLWWNPAVYFLKSGMEHMLELRCDKNVCSILKNNDERDLYANTLIFVSEKQLPTKKVLISGYTGRKPNIIYRFEEIFKRNALISDILKPCITFLLLLLSIVLFILSYQFIVQPIFRPPSMIETVLPEANIKEDVNDNKSSFIVRMKDGTFIYYENGKHAANITEDMLDQEPYCNVPIYDKK